MVYIVGKDNASCMYVFMSCVCMYVVDNEYGIYGR